MFSDIQIKVDTPQEYTVTYRIHKFTGDKESQKEFIKQCKLALEDAFRVAGIKETN